MQIEKQRPSPGSGLRILTETITSPTLANQIQELLKTLPSQNGISMNRSIATMLLKVLALHSAQPVETRYKFDQADVVLSLDADFFIQNPWKYPLYSRFYFAQKSSNRRR